MFFLIRKQYVMSKGAQESSANVVSITCGREGSGMVPELWRKPLWESGPCLDPWDRVRLRTVSMHWNVPGEK